MKQPFYPRDFRGLVIPPEKITSCEQVIEQTTAPEHRRCFVDRHHLYWPHADFQKSQLTHDFAEHRSNSVWMLRCQHNSIYENFRGTRPPKVEVMQEFLRGAKILDRLGVLVNAVGNIDNAFAEGRIKHINKALDHRYRHMETIKQVVSSPPELVHRSLTEIALQPALELLKSA